MTSEALVASSEQPLRVLDIHASELGEYPNLIRDIADQRIHVALVRGVFSQEAAATIVERLEVHGEGASRLTEVAPQFRIYSFGLALDTAQSLEQYLGEAKLFLPECQRIFRDVPNYLQWMPELLARISGGRPVELPAYRGSAYNPTTIRRLPPGAFIPPHCEFEQLNRPAYTHLKEVIGQSAILSFYTTLRPPDVGGEAFISTVRWGDLPIAEDGRTAAAAAAAMDRAPAMTFLPGIGDLILFDGGRLYHQVLRIGGERPRWTIGGFMSENASRDRVVYWS